MAGIVELDLPLGPGRPEHPADDEYENDYLQYYGVQINTDKGAFTLEYRNSSNGYYGGSLGESEVHTQKKPILGDWSS